MASTEKEEIKKELEIALKEIGEIKPWFESDFKCWIYSNPLYPVECEGKSAADVIKKYPKYLKVFIEHRLQGRLDAVNEIKTKGKGGYRPGAGRPKGTFKEPTKQKRIPVDIAEWFDTNPMAFEQVRQLMRHRRCA